jgi:hypothetical protein
MRSEQATLLRLLPRLMKKQAQPVQWDLADITALEVV